MAEDGGVEGVDMGEDGAEQIDDRSYTMAWEA